MNEFPPILTISSRNGFHDALRGAFAEAAAAGCRELWLCDTSFADWPLGERAVIESLTQWAHPQRRITLLAQDFDEVMRRHPRWVSWHRQWSHLVKCRINLRLGAEMPTLFVAPGWFSLRLSLADPVRWRGRLSRHASDTACDQELFDAVLQHSDTTFPTTTTGL